MEELDVVDVCCEQCWSCVELSSCRGSHHLLLPVPICVRFRGVPVVRVSTAVPLHSVLASVEARRAHTYL